MEKLPLQMMVLQSWSKWVLFTQQQKWYVQFSKTLYNLIFVKFDKDHNKINYFKVATPIHQIPILLKIIIVVPMNIINEFWLFSWWNYPEPKTLKLVMAPHL